MRQGTFFCIDAHTCGNPVRLVAGGVPPPTGISTTEEWSPETTTANIANFTTS